MVVLVLVVAVAVVGLDTIHITIARILTGVLTVVGLTKWR